MSAYFCIVREQTFCDWEAHKVRRIPCLPPHTIKRFWDIKVVLWRILNFWLASLDPPLATRGNGSGQPNF